MHIVIPTRGRKDKQYTLHALPRELRKRTTLVCPKAEVLRRLKCLDDDIEVVAQPDADWRIAQVRGWIVQEWLHRGNDKIVMLDDDLSFAMRKSENGSALRTIRGKVLVPEFERLEKKLGPEYPHVGFGQRQFNNSKGADWVGPVKMVCTLGYYLPIVAKLVRWDLVELREDYSATLQLLLKGYPNAIWTGTVVDQKTNAPGGCSTYRTAELNDAEAEKLAAIPEFAPFVSVRVKNYASGPRKEPRIDWVQALAHGRTQCRHR
jgi:hypothetical protein